MHISPDSGRMAFSPVKATIWIKDSYFNQKQWFEVVHVLIICLLNMQLHKMLTGGLEWWGLLVNYCDVFQLDSFSDGTHSLQRIH